MIPLREPLSRVVIRARVLQILRDIAPVLGLTINSALDIARKVLADDEAEDPRDHDGD